MRKDIWKLKMHAAVKGRIVCGQVAKRSLRRTNVSKMETCVKCKRILKRRGM